MALAPVFNLAADGKTVTLATPLAAGSYNLQLVATQSGAGNSPLTANIPITVVTAGGLPGTPSNLTQVSTTTNSAVISFAPPTSGGALDRGKYQVQYITGTASYTDNGPIIPYCTVSSGSITDGFGNVWTVVPSGGGNPNAILVNGVYADGWNLGILMMSAGVIYHVNVGGQWYSYTPTGGSLAGGSVSWTAIGASPLTSVSVTNLAAGTTYSMRVYVTNSTGQGPPTQPVAVSTSSGSGGVQPPAQAAAVGFNTLTSTGTTLGANWFPLGNANIRQNADGSFTDLGVPQPNAYNAHVSTVQGTSGTFKGVAFGGGGYFEVTWLVSGGWPINNTDGWPAWWATSVEADAFPSIPPTAGRPQDSHGQNLEYDACEQFGDNSTAYNAGIIVWGSDQSPGANNLLFSNSGVNCVYGGTNQTGRAAWTPPGLTLQTKVKMGWLWVTATATTPGYIKNYLNDVQVGDTYQWNQYQGGTFPTGPGEDRYSIMDAQHSRLWLGSGSVSQITVYNVNVWQKDDSKNIRAGVPLPNPNPPPSGGTGPAATSSFLAADFTAAFNSPAGSGQQIISQGMYGVGSSSLADNNYAAWANSSVTTNLAVCNPGTYMLKSYSGCWNSDLSVNTGAIANLVNNFYKADPLGVAKVWFCVQQASIPSYTPARCGTAVGNLANYLFNFTMPNGKKFPLLGFANEDEPDGHFQQSDITAQLQAMRGPVKAVSNSILIGGPQTSYEQGDWGLVASVPIDFLIYNCFNEGSQSPGGFPIAWNDTATVANMLPRYTSDAQAVNGLTGSLQYIGMAGYGMDWDTVADAQNSHLGAMFAAAVCILTHNVSRYPYLPCFWGGFGNGTAGIITDPGQAGFGYYGVGNTMQVTPKGYMYAEGVRKVFGPRWNVPTNSAGLLVMATKPTSTSFGMMVVNNTTTNRSGPVALSHWPVNSTGNGSVRVWQLTSAQNVPGIDGAVSSVNVTAGLTASINFPGPSVTIISGG